MEYCVLCSRKVCSGNHDQFSCEDEHLDCNILKAEVTAQFLKTFNRVSRLVRETDTSEDAGKSNTYNLETNNNMKYN